MSVDTKLKVTAVGDGAVGKTCLLIVYTTGKFPEVYIPTVFDTYVAEVSQGGVNYEVKLFDTAGQEDYERLLPLSFTGTTCFLVCFSINSINSYENISTKWYPSVRHHMPHTPIVLVGTKSDLRRNEDPNRPLLTRAQGHELKKKIKAAEYLECSAMENEGIKEIIDAAVKHSKIRRPVVPRQRKCGIF